MSTILRVLDIVAGTSVDGPGLRTAIYLAGCSHHCKGCHNPQSWAADGGKAMSVDEIMEIVRDNDFNVTLTGGDPMFQAERLKPLLKALNEDGYTVWCYTGYTIEQIRQIERMNALLPYFEAVVDGRYEETLRDGNLRFRGSSNQRIIMLGEDGVQV